jgi:predicted dehydrogenase
LKVGVIGAGYWGKKHVDEYSALGHEIFVSDLSDDSLEFCRLNYDTQTTNDYHDILNDNEIKTVSICTPNATHHQLAIESLEAGKNILLEKPIDINSNESDKIIRLAKEKNLVILVGHIFRFNNAITKTKEIIQSKLLGKIFNVNLLWNNLEPIYKDRDILFDLSVHPLDILDNIFGKTPKNIHCVGNGFRQDNAEFAIINCQIENDFSNKDIFVNIELSWLNPIKNRKMIIIGSEKTMVVECVQQKIKIINNQSGLIESLNIRPNNTIRDELEYFLNLSYGETKENSNAPHGETAKKIIKIIEQANKSLNNNHST